MGWNQWMQSCQDHPGRPREAGVEKIFGDDEEKPSFKTVGFLTGHCQLSKHHHTMGLVDTPLRRMCEQEDESVRLVLCECPELSSIRECVFGNVPSPPKNTSSSSNQQGFATLIVMIAVLFIIVLFCCFAAPGIRMMCKRYIFRRCFANDHNIDNGSTRSDEVCTPTVILLPNGRMLVIDRSVLRTELELMEISTDLFNPHLGSTPSILDSSETSKGISPTSLGVPPPTYEDVFPDFPPSYSEISLVQKSVELKKCKLNENVVNCDGLVSVNGNCE